MYELLARGSQLSVEWLGIEPLISSQNYISVTTTLPIHCILTSWHTSGFWLTFLFHWCHHWSCYDVQIDDEYKNPGSQKREALGKIPQMWGQSLYVLASLVKEVSAVCLQVVFICIIMMRILVWCILTCARSLALSTTAFLAYFKIWNSRWFLRKLHKNFRGIVFCHTLYILLFQTIIVIYIFWQIGWAPEATI